jgi:FKBP-type peptidyl-prolyl cis-trans isomerase (trigger factor)
MAKKATTSTTHTHNHTHDHDGHDHSHGHTHSHAPSAIGPNTQIKITLTWKEIDPVYKKAVQKLSSRVKLDGFRKGKVPAHLAETAIGIEKIRDIVFDELLPEAYSKAIVAGKHQPLTNPRLSIETANVKEDWVVIAEIAEPPVIDLKKFKDFVKAGKKAGAENIKKQQEELKKLAKENKDKKDEKATVTKPTELNEDQQEVRSIFAELVTGINPTVPELLVHQETKADLENLVKTLDQLKLSFDDYMARRGQSFEDISAEMAASALSRLQLELILGKIAEAEKLAVSEEDITKEIDTSTS